MKSSRQGSGTAAWPCAAKPPETERRVEKLSPNTRCFKTYDPKALTTMNCTNLQAYLDRYGSLVADRARQAFEPLHVPATDAVVELDLKRAMLPARAMWSRPPSKPCGGKRPCSSAANAAPARRRWGPAPCMPTRRESPIGRS